MLSIITCDIRHKIVLLKSKFQMLILPSRILCQQTRHLRSKQIISAAVQNLQRRQESSVAMDKFGLPKRLQGSKPSVWLVEN